MHVRHITRPGIACTLIGLLVAGCGGGGGQAASDTTHVAGGAMTGAGTTAAIAATSIPSGPVPAVVDSLGTAGEDLYDAVQAGSWSTAAKLVAELDSGGRHAPLAVATLNDSLRKVVDSLRAAVTAHQQRAAANEANRATYLAAEMTKPYTSPTPTEVLLLDYEGRELVLANAEGDSARLNRTTSDIHTLWASLGPRVIARGHQTAATRTAAIIARIDAARTRSQWRAASTALLDQVDVLERVFTNQ